MGYYRGTQFGQGYYTGAQGGFFSGIGKFFGTAVQRLAPAAALIPGPVGVVGKALSVIGQHPVTAAVAGGAVGAATTALVGRAGAQPGAGVVPHMRLTGGAAAGGPSLHLHLGRGGQAAGTGRKRRRMNACNPRALRRAIRRFKSFEHMARHVINFTHAKKVKRGYAKSPRKRAA